MFIQQLYQILKIPLSTPLCTFLGILSISIITAISLVTIALVPIRKKNHQLISFFVAFSAGCLVGDVAFHLIPEMDGFAENGRSGFNIWIPVVFIVGIYAFFAMEKYLQTYHHGHGHECNAESFLNCQSEMVNSRSPPERLDSNENFYRLANETPNSSPCQNTQLMHERCYPIFAPMIYSVIAGDVLHNFIDGIAIGASFFTSLRTGITTSVAILFHEIPHELADFAVLVGSGISYMRAFWLCLLSNLSAFLGIAVTVLLGRSEQMRQLVLSFTAGVFMYVALADLVPELLHKHKENEYSCNSSSENALPAQGNYAKKLSLVTQHAGILLGCFLMISIRFIE